MKRQELIRHLRSHGCELLREGRGHSVWVNPANQRQASVPRHREINEYTARTFAVNSLSPIRDDGQKSRQSWPHSR